MPVITANSRPVIGGHSEESFRQPRAFVKAATGMHLESIPKPDETPNQLPPPAKTGQSDIGEDTGSPAVTLSPQLTQLARKQQKYQQEVQALRDREAALALKEADYIPKSTFKSKLQTNAAEALRELGVDYNELTDLVLNQTQSDDPVKKLEAEIQGLKSAQEQNVSKQYEATVNQYRKEIETLVSSDENLVTIKEEGAQDSVLQHILDTFNNDGEILSVEEASKDIEDYLVEEALKRANFTKVKAKLAPPTAGTQEKTLPPPQKAAPRTLTNQVESAPTRTHNQFQHLSMKERIAQAIARAQK